MKRSLLQSFGYAFRGLLFAVKTERNIKLHLVAAAVAVGFGFYLGISATAWCLVVLAIGLVLAAELLNTALEKWCDAAGGGKKSEAIKNAKDISAAAVIAAVIVSVIIGVLVLLIPLIRRWW